MIPGFERYGEFLTDEGRSIAKVFREFVDKEIMPYRLEIDEDKERKIIHRISQGLVNLGLQKSYLPKEIGGSEMRDNVLLEVLCEELARGDIGLATELFISAAWVHQPAIWSNNKVVLEKFCRPYTGDEVHVGCVALTEPHGGCNIESHDARGRAIRTIAKLEGDEWVINGAKRWPSGASISDVYCTICTTDPKLGTDGVALIYVPGDAPGLTFGKWENKCGMRYSDINADIYYDNVRVPKEYRAGGPGSAPGQDHHSFVSLCTGGRMYSAAAALGPAQECLDIIINYTGTRYYAGKKVREHSLQACLIGDLIISLESARAFYLTVAQELNHPEVYGDMASNRMLSRATAAKCYSADVAFRICHTAMDFMCSYGYVKETHVEKYMRDVKMANLWVAGPHLNRIDVARGYYPTLPYETVEPFE